MHVYVRIHPEHGFKDVRRGRAGLRPRGRAADADDVTTTWWRKDRDPRKLFVDYNQNARDHTIAAAYSVRGLPDARVSTPIAGTRSTTPTRATSRSSPCPPGSPRSATCTRPSTSTSSTSRPLLEWAERDEAEGAETPDEPEPTDD